MSAITQLRYESAGAPDPALLFAAVEAFPGSMAVLNSGIVLYANPAWAQMFECADRSRIQGQTVEDVLASQIFSTALTERSGRASTGELVHLLPDGTQAQLRFACASFRMRSDEFRVLSAYHAGPGRQAEVEVRDGQGLEAIGRLAGGVAHDFNNLLTGIMLYCDLLIAELKKDSRSWHHVREIRQAGEQGAKLVEQLLAVARPRIAEPRLVSINEVVAGIEELVTRLIGENILLTTSLAGDLGAVRMDPAHLQQILLNLVLNARDAMPEGGHIVLTTRNCADHPHAHEDDDADEGDRGCRQCERPQLVFSAWGPCVELTVSDTGLGMDPETLDHAFEPFFTTKKDGRGNGLGLATARRLAKLEGGTILAESQPGKGTRVSLRLPRGRCVRFDRLRFESSIKPDIESEEVIQHDYRRTQRSQSRSDRRSELPQSPDRG